MITGINHITISTKDLDQSFNFYTTILGLRPLLKHSSGAYLLAGDVWFCLDLDTEARSSELSEYTHFAFSTNQENFKNFQQKIINSGAKIWKQNKSEGDSLYFLDPDHHKLELHVGNWSTRIEDYKLNNKLTNPIYYV
jgi:catechol 2,3-dioxygenase-like lactoylglutathione lyase family enzyme